MYSLIGYYNYDYIVTGNHIQAMDWNLHKKNGKNNNMEMVQVKRLAVINN